MILRGRVLPVCLGDGRGLLGLLLRLCRSGGGLWAQNLVGLFGRDRRADQVEEHAAGGSAPVAVGQQQAAGALDVQRPVEERLHLGGSQDTHGALERFPGARLGLPELGDDLGGDLVDGAGRVSRRWRRLSRIHTTMLAGPDPVGTSLLGTGVTHGTTAARLLLVARA